MADLREALEKAAVGLRKYRPTAGDDELIAFLRSLEESGWKLVGPERTEKMVNAAISTFGRDDDRSSTEMTIDCCDAYFAAAPTIADLLEEPPHDR